MKSSHLPLNALRAFEASARQLSFTRAGLELRVTQAAVSHQVKSLEETLGVQLFRRLPRGLALTDEGQALLPTIAESFDRIRATAGREELPIAFFSASGDGAGRPVTVIPKPVRLDGLVAAVSALLGDPTR